MKYKDRHHCFTIILIITVGLCLLTGGCAVPVFQRLPIDPDVYANHEYYSDQSENHGRKDQYNQFLTDLEGPGYALPGMAMLLEDPENGTWVGTKGYLDLEYQVLWEKNSISKIGSISKSFGSVICLKLQEQGKIDLDNLISSYLKESDIEGIANADRASIRQVLNHTSGIPDNLRNPEWVQKYLHVEERMFNDVYEALELARGLEAKFDPGEGFVYSNTNYDLIQLLIEAVLNMPIQQAIEELITTPLGMRSTWLPYDPEVPVGVARAYNDYYSTGNLTDVTQIELASNVLEGGLVSNVYDLAAFIKAVAFDDQFLSPESREQMMVRGHKDSTILSAMDPSLNDYEGLGMSVMTYKGKTYICNSGGCKGYTSYVAACLETEEVFVLLVNGQGGKVGWTVFQGILKGILEDIAG